MATLSQYGAYPLPAPATEPRAVNQYECRHSGISPLKCYEWTKARRFPSVAHRQITCLHERSGWQGSHARLGECRRLSRYGTHHMSSRPHSLTMWASGLLLYLGSTEFGCGPGWYTPWCAWARPNRPSRSWPGSAKREHGEMRIAAAVLRLAQDDLRAATAALAPVLAASARVGWRLGVVNLGAAGWLLSLGRGGPGRRGCRGGRACTSRRSPPGPRPRRPGTRGSAGPGPSAGG